jgi:hypothetical protein
MKKTFLIALVAAAACNTSPKVAPTEAVAIPLDQQLSQLDDSVRDMSKKILSDSTFSSDSAFVKQFNDMASRREVLKQLIEKAQTDSAAQ